MLVESSTKFSFENEGDCLHTTVDNRHDSNRHLSRHISTNQNPSPNHLLRTPLLLSLSFPLVCLSILTSRGSGSARSASGCGAWFSTKRHRLGLHRPNSGAGETTRVSPMNGGRLLSNPYHSTSGIPEIPDGSDDVLKYLVFSDPDYTEPLALPAPPVTESTIELSNAVLQDSSLSGNRGQTLNEIPTISVNPRDQILVLPTLEGHESAWHASSSHEGALPEDDPGASLWGGNDMDLGGWINEVQEPTFNNDGLHIEPEDGVYPIILPLNANCIDCSGCHVLREVVHTNGLQNMKLTIHGGLVGCFYHALIQIEYNTDGTSLALEQSYADLRELSFKCVKQFLTDYSLLRMREGFYVIQDSLSDFLDTMCVPMSHEVPSTSNQELCLEESGSDQPEPTVTDNIATRIPKTGIAAQRARTGSLHIRDLAHCFHLPIVDAAKKLNLCATALKKICRRHGLDRWPHRKIKSINKKISKLQRDMLSGSGEGIARTHTEIERLNARRTQIYIELSR